MRGSLHHLSEVRRGEILFLVDGNGSGKTTLLKLFTALYRPAQGAIRVDDVEIGPANIQSSRNLLSAVFSDFHLFDKLHGLSDAAPERVNALLRLMEISHRTAFDGRFTNTHLPTGQRKRLALVGSYLEDKPVYIFDEVAADQDPQFRRYFYETMLPELNSTGKKVVVASHDDRYFHVGDRVLGMDYGKPAGKIVIRGPLDSTLFHRGIEFAHPQHDVQSLRIHVDGEDGFVKEAECRFEAMDFSGRTDPFQSAVDWMLADIGRPMREDQFPLCGDVLALPLRNSADVFSVISCLGCRYAPKASKKGTWCEARTAPQR